MTRKTLHRWTLFVLALYTTAIAVGVILRFYAPDSNKSASIAYQTYKDLIPFLFAIPAAWLGFCFQRRSSYLSALRQLWHSLIPAVQTAIQFTYIKNPKPEDFTETQKELSVMIDSLRGVFENIPTNNAIGLYPYENLKEIHKITGWLYLNTENTEDEKYWARTMITTLWSSMHHMLLLEFDREVPIHPLSHYANQEISLSKTLINCERNEDGKLNNEKLEQCVQEEYKKQKRRLCPR